MTGPHASAAAQRYMIVSSDCHAGADILDYKPYLEQRWHEEFDAWAASYHDPWIDVDAGREELRAGEGLRVGSSSGAMPTNWDSRKRLEDLEADGIVGEVIFPNTAPPFFPSGALTAPAPRTRYEYERRWAGLRAHNRWLVDFCGDVPGRRAGVAQIALNDVEDAVAEIEWLDGSGLTGGILLPQVEPNCGLAPLYSEVYEPIWAACEDHGVPIHHHSAATGLPTEADGTTAGRAVMFYEHKFFGHRGLWQLILAGVFERHPKLKFIMTELTCGWVVECLNTLDVYAFGSRQPGTGLTLFFGPAFENLNLLPSEYFQRNCYLGASFMLPSEAALRAKLGVDRIMWGADYPHSEGTFPWSREALRAACADVSVEECRPMFGETAAELYRLDREALRSAADRVGPTVEEIAEPLTEPPKVPDDTACPVFMHATPVFGTASPVLETA